MRWLFIILLVANAIYLGRELAIETRITAANQPVAVNIPASADRLRLLGEMTSPPAIRERSPLVDSGDSITAIPMMDPVPLPTADFTDSPSDISTATDMPAGSASLVADLPEFRVEDTQAVLQEPVCYRFGPLPDQQVIQGLQDWFRSRDAIATMGSGEEPPRNLFWIYLAPQSSREGALALIREMQSQGIGDYRLINRGDMQNAISLGLYSSREAVDNRLRELGDKGYVPVVVPYTDVRRTWWLDVRLGKGQAVVEEMQNGYPARYDPLPVDCEDTSGI